MPKRMEIYIPRIKDLILEPVESLVTKFSCKVQPRILKADGRLVKPHGDVWFKNLITNNGLDRACTAGGIFYFLYSPGNLHVGTGTTTPANSDTALTTFVKSTGSYAASGTSSSQDTVNGTFTGNQLFQFSTEASTVTYTECGLSIQGTTGGLITHATFPGVTLNSGDTFIPAYSFTESIPCIGTPITVSLAAVNGFNISGSMKVCGTFTNLFGTVAAGGGWSNGLWGAPLHGSSAGIAASTLLTGPTTFPATNTLVTETGAIGGNLPVWNTYTNGSFSRAATILFGASAVLSGTNCIRILSAGVQNGLYLILTSAQNKGATNLQFTLTLTASRV